MVDVLPKLGDWMFSSDDPVAKLLRSFPWLMRYWAGQLGRRLFGGPGSSGPDHLIFMVANHYEPAWNKAGMPMDLAFQRPRVKRWCNEARSVGAAFKDSDGMPFCHTYFYPAEQYHSCLVEELAALQMERLGEVEIHLHHGVDRPDHPIKLRETLVRFRDLLAGEHGCLSRMDGNGRPMYAFVHGNYALANSARGRFCGVDSELQILAETGCYSDFTLPTAPDCTQVPRINSIYQCGGPFDRRCAHKRGDPLRVGAVPKLPIVFTGPLVLDWSRRVRGVPFPRIDIGAIADNYRLSLDRLNRWRQKARVCVKGRPEWIFIKLFCHGFFPWDRQMLLGEPLRRFLDQLLDHSAGSGEFKVHFATAREAFNMVMAGVDGHAGEPGLYRNYRLKPVSNGLSETSALQFHPYDSASRGGNGRSI